MITITTPKVLTIATARLQPYKLVKAMRDVFHTPSDVYTIQRAEKDAVSAVMLSSANFDALIAGVDSLKSLPVKIKFQHLPSEAASKRFEEIYNLVLGKDELSLGTGRLAAYGFQHKIDAEGQQEDFEVETSVAAGGEVVSAYPIVAGSVSAVKLPSLAALTVTAVDEQLGTVALDDGILPVADGVSVQLVYQTTDYLAYLIQDEANLANEAIIVSQALYAYLLANQ